jgi:hypothetical protein
MGAPDAVEGGLAYVERRPPRWRGRVSADWPEWPRPDAETTIEREDED